MTPRPPSLSEDLRRRTAEAHVAAERSPYLVALVEGRVTQDGLAALLGRLLPVYQALEEVAARWQDDPVAGVFLLPGLARAERLRDDLASLTGSVEPPVSAAADAYAVRVRQVGGAGAVAFVAHHYTRCLGDLSGGQVIGAAVRRHLGLADRSGASFFAFPQLRPAQAKARYRALLDAAALSPAQREELVAEAREAYRLNVALVAELDADLERWTGG